MSYHRLLKRQIKKILNNDSELLENTNLQNFLEAVNETYEWSDTDRNRLTLSLEIVSEELGEGYEEAQLQIKRMQEAREEQKRLFSIIQSTLNASLDGMLLVSETDDFIFMNQKVVDLFDSTKEELIYGGYETILDFVTQKTRSAKIFERQLNNIKDDKKKATACILEFFNGKIIEVNSQPRMQNGNLAGRIWSFHDITETRYNKQTTGYKAYHDALTNLPNRHFLAERINHALSDQEKKPQKFCLMYIDLDGFKFINDTLGHEVGDDVLKEISERLKTVVYGKGMVARHGGDEFLVIIEKYTHEEEITDIAEQILKVTSKSLNLSDFEYYLSSSIGIVVAPQDGNNASTLIRNADIAMYSAKQHTKNCFMYFEPSMADHSKHELHLKNQLHVAIEKKEFSIYFQPKIDMRSRKLIGAEALIRWFRNGEQVLAPNKFIETAERTGLILPISEWVINEVLKQVAVWKDLLPDDFSMGINVSAKHFKYPNMVSKLKEEVILHDINPATIELEITESVVMDSPKKSIKKLEELRDYGFNLAIDDFGTGYSSFNYLKDLPISVLKIDRSFISNTEFSSRDVSLVSSIIDIAHTLNLTVVAEGIENEKTHDIVRDIGCDIAQGYLYGKPMPAEDFTKLFTIKEFV